MRKRTTESSKTVTVTQKGEFLRELEVWATVAIIPVYVDDSGVVYDYDHRLQDVSATDIESGEKLDYLDVVEMLHEDELCEALLGNSTEETMETM